MACYRQHETGYPCGDCLGCRLSYKQQWALRGWHEAELHAENSFVTLTYNEGSVPPGGSLDRRAVPLFMKRLRKAIAPERVSVLYAGEYGTRTGRPHYHACLFGVGFPDRTPVGKRGDFPVWRSPTLEACWPHGRSEIGSLTKESVAYVVGYVVKKARRRPREDLLGVDAATGEVWPIVREFTGMSRRPAIGKRWIERYGEEVFAHAGVVVDGRVVGTPRYYDQQLAELDPDRFDALCTRRERDAWDSLGERTAERLAVREKVAQAAENLKERSLE